MAQWQWRGPESIFIQLRLESKLNVDILPLLQGPDPLLPTPEGCRSGRGEDSDFLSRVLAYHGTGWGGVGNLGRGGRFSSTGLGFPEVLGTSPLTTLGFLKSCQSQVPTLPSTFRPTMSASKRAGLGTHPGRAGPAESRNPVPGMGRRD